MVTKTLRIQSDADFTTKGTPLTNVEVDNTFIGLNTDIKARLPLIGGVLSGILGIADGTVTTPSVYFGSNPNTGFYKQGTNSIGFSSNGVLSAILNTTGIDVVDGTNANPSYSFLSSPTTGFYRYAANSIGVSINGTTLATLDATGLKLFSGDLTTSATSVNIFNTTATTLNIGGAATTVTFGASGGIVTVGGNMAVNGTGYFQIAAGTTAQRPTGAAGRMRYNSTTGQYEAYYASTTSWGAIGGGAKGGGSDNIFYENGQTITTNYTLASATNAMSAGPITINDGVTVTISDNAYWVIV